MKRTAPHILLALFALFLVPAQAVAQDAPATLTEVVTVEGVTEYMLSNGLRVLLVPDQSKQTTTVNITYFVGSRHEAYGETGMAHLLEHLVFKGTPNHPNIPQELTERGTRPNGTTWFDRTNYFETFTATEDNLEWALDLEADRMVNSFQVERPLEVVVRRGERLEVVRAVEPGRAVGPRAPLRELLRNVGVIRCALEHQVLEEMGHAGLTVRLVPRSHEVRDVDRGRLFRLVRYEQDPEAVREHVLRDALDRYDLGQGRRLGLFLRYGPGRHGELEHGGRHEQGRGRAR